MVQKLEFFPMKIKIFQIRDGNFGINFFLTWQHVNKIFVSNDKIWKINLISQVDFSNILEIHHFFISKFRLNQRNHTKICENCPMLNSKFLMLAIFDSKKMCTDWTITWKTQSSWLSRNLLFTQLLWTILKECVDHEFRKFPKITLEFDRKKRPQLEKIDAISKIFNRENRWFLQKMVEINDYRL